MPRDSQGAYNLPNGTLVSAGDTIQVSQHNPAMSDIAVALSQSLSRTGQGAMQAPLDMGGYAVTNAGNITATSITAPTLNASSLGGVAAVSYARKDTPQSFESSISVTNYLTVKATSGDPFSYLYFQTPTGAYQSDLRVGSDNILRYAGQRMTLAGQNVAVDGMGRTSFVVRDGTASPSGGSNGDLYFQYS